MADFIVGLLIGTIGGSFVGIIITSIVVTIARR